jgi:transposase
MFRGAVRNPDFIHFLKRLRRHLRRKLILLADRLPAHRSKNARQYFKSQKHWLTIEWFPAYAPELNPVEYLWSASKRKDFANFCPETSALLDKRIRQSIRRIRRKPNLLTGFLKASQLF